MEERNIKISLEKAKGWYKQNGELRRIALQAFSEDELKEPSKPKTWEEFCHNFRNKITDYYIDDNSNIVSIRSEAERLTNYNRNLCTSKEEAEAFRALMQLRQLRKAWVGDWEPDWNAKILKSVIFFDKNRIVIDSYWCHQHTLSFLTREMAEDFLTCFKNFIKTAKVLL